MTDEWTTGGTPRHHRTFPLELVALALLFIGTLWFEHELVTASLATCARWTVAITIASAWLVARSAPRGAVSPSSVYCITLAVFHSGLAAVVAVGYVPEAEFPSLKLWLHRPSTLTAMWLVAIASTSYALGVRVAHLWPPARFRRREQSSRLDHELAWSAATLMGASISAWFLVAVLNGGPGILVGTYADFLRLTAGTPLPFFYHGIGLAAVMAAACPWSKYHRVTASLFVVWGLFAFPLGLRGELLFPTVAAIAIVATRRRLMSAWRVAVIAVVLLGAIAAARQVRSVGISSVTETAVSANPLDGLAEMGASLRPVSEVVFWQQMGDPFDHGATYWAPIDRALVYVIPGWTRPPIDRDYRIMNILVMERVGPIGFSTVAEAYRNFATLGVIGVLLLCGLLMGRIDTWPRSAIHQAIAGTIMIALLGHVRNSFVPVPTQLLVGFALTAAVYFKARGGGARR
jgi:hypothetical protein